MQLAAQHGDSLAALSRMLGRNAAWMHQYLYRGSPRVLPDTDRLKLAQFFNVDERQLGARDPWTPA